MIGDDAFHAPAVIVQPDSLKAAALRPRPWLCSELQADARRA
jgi:hypothetical protein